MPEVTQITLRKLPSGGWLGTSKTCKGLVVQSSSAEKCARLAVNVGQDLINLRGW